jgi:hypothetical protein
MPRKGGVVYVGRKSNTGLVIIGILLLVFLGYIANQAGYLGPKLNISVGGGQVTTTVPSGTQPLAGIVTSDVAAYDSLDVATTRTVGTDVKVLWYAYRSGWQLLGSGDAADLSVTKEDMNTIYAVVSGTASYYVDYAKTMSMNQRVKNVEYKDIDGDNTKEFVFRLDLTDIPFASSTGKYVMPSFNVYALTYDSSAGISSPDNQVAGTSKVTKYIEWYTTISSEKKGLAVYKVVLKVNSTDISEFKLVKLNIPGLGNLDGSSFSQDVLSSETRWTYQISQNLYGADYLKRAVGALNKFEFTTTVEVDLSSYALNWTLYVYYYTASEGSASLSDAVLLTTS